MKKIKISEKQASLLGLNKIMENEEGGVKSVGVALGEVVIRMVVSGDNVPKFKDRIIQLIARHDKDAKVGFFEATGKIVGNIKEIKLDSIKRDIKALDPTIMVEKKPLVKSLKEDQKKIVKITKEQYNRIFAGKMINENSDVKGGINRIDKEFKNEFETKKINNIKSTDIKEDEFDIKKPNASISKTAQGKFGKPVNEHHDIKNEAIELLKYLYRKSEDLSPFWEEHGLKYDDIVNDLLEKKIIISKNGKHELSKSLGSPQAALQAFEDELKNLVGCDEEPKTEVEPELETEESNYPAGAADEPNAPWNKSDSDTTKAKIAKNPELEVVAMNNEIAILKSPSGDLFVFYYGEINKKDFMEYASVTRHYVGKDEEGQPEYEYDDDFSVDDHVISNYVNDNLSTLSKGEGLEAYESGVDLVKIDEPLKKDLASLYDKDKKIASVLGPIEEEQDYSKLMGQLKGNIERATTKTPSTEAPEAKQSRIIAKLAELKAKEKERREKEAKEIEDRRKAAELEEMTGTGSAGAFTPALDMPVVKREMPETPVVAEITSGTQSVGPYDANALPGINRDGSFKESKKTKAQSKTQWAGGGFVEFSDCTKLNNGKGAQNGKCSQGAVDNVVKVKKTHGNINAPSLGENEIYETIAKKTGKTIDEVKRIIEAKKKDA